MSPVRPPENRFARKGEKAPEAGVRDPLSPARTKSAKGRGALRNAMLDGLGIARLLSELTPHLGRKIYRVEFADSQTFLVVHAGGSLVFFLDPEAPLFFAVSSEDDLGKELLRTAQEARKKAPQLAARLLPWRRALEGGILVRAEQLARDRVFALGVDMRSQTGERRLLRLVAELVPRYANLLLVEEKGGILAVFRPVNAGMSRYRRLVPGGRYAPVSYTHLTLPTIYSV